MGSQRQKDKQQFLILLNGIRKNGYDYSTQSFRKTKLNIVGATLKVILQKHKELIGDDK